MKKAKSLYQIIAQAFTGTLIQNKVNAVLAYDYSASEHELYEYLLKTET